MTYQFTNAKKLEFRYSGFSKDGYNCYYFYDSMLYYRYETIQAMITSGKIIEIN